MTQTSSKRTQYRVKCPVTQIRSEAPGSEKYPERTLRFGQVLPFWVKPDEIEHLLAFHAIEAIA